MTQRDNILQELRELQSSLANTGPQNVYQVPGGYFEGLAEQVLNRIKALDTDDAAEELTYLSPLLSGISKQMPYAVPAGFFDGVTESIIASVKIGGTTAAEELEELSPFLSGLKKEMPFSVPKDYFEKLDTSINKKEIRPVGKVVSFTSQKWFRYAAAAVVIGFVATAGFLLFTRNGNVDPKTESAEWVIKNTKKIGTDEINNFVELTEESPVVASIDSRSDIKDKNEIQELIKDVPEKDIEDFLEETQTGETDNNDKDVITN